MCARVEQLTSKLRLGALEQDIEKRDISHLCVQEDRNPDSDDLRREETRGTRPSRFVFLDHFGMYRKHQ